MLPCKPFSYFLAFQKCKGRKKKNNKNLERQKENTPMGKENYFHSFKEPIPAINGGRPKMKQCMKYFWGCSFKYGKLIIRMNFVSLYQGKYFATSKDQQVHDNNNWSHLNGSCLELINYYLHAQTLDFEIMTYSVVYKSLIIMHSVKWGGIWNWLCN